NRSVVDQTCRSGMIEFFSVVGQCLRVALSSTNRWTRAAQLATRTVVTQSFYYSLYNLVGAILMANTCSICKHSKRKEIESAMVAGQSLRNIAKQFDVGHSAANRHQDCIAESLREARHRREIEHALNLDELIRRAVARVGKLMDALDDYLSDPAHQDRYF